MAKESASSTLVNIFVWIVGLIVALAVGAGMIDATLTVPYLSDIWNGVIVKFAGWVVVVGALLSLVLAIFDK